MAEYVGPIKSPYFATKFKALAPKFLYNTIAPQLLFLSQTQLDRDVFFALLAALKSLGAAKAYANSSCCLLHSLAQQHRIIPDLLEISACFEVLGLVEQGRQHAHAASMLLSPSSLLMSRSDSPPPSQRGMSCIDCFLFALRSTARVNADLPHPTRYHT